MESHRWIADFVPSARGEKEEKKIPARSIKASFYVEMEKSNFSDSEAFLTKRSLPKISTEEC
ncbi:hypothetical protein DLM78_16750 [Leptospira stimsonii]|uniref:Uncharacterized protein n=1 Tax=Leptospira stimsonii TaxID=2202203 RepID=A0A8B3CLL1_9LEPT|nr:hypothetical protein DLM78_16750 [Leptospira stimsonii]